MSATKSFLDTNILVYAFSPDEPSKHERAMELIHLAGSHRSGVISYQVVQEFFAVGLRKFRHSLTPTEGERVLDVVLRPLLAVESSLQLFRSALAIESRHRLPWYDALIVAAGLEANCRILYSEDFQHGQEFGALRVVNPFL